MVGKLSQAEGEKRLLWGRSVLRSADSLVQGTSPRMAYVMLTSGFGRDPPPREAVVCSWQFMATCSTRARGGPLRTCLEPAIGETKASQLNPVLNWLLPQLCLRPPCRGLPAGCGSQSSDRCPQAWVAGRLSHWPGSCLYPCTGSQPSSRRGPFKVSYFQPRSVELALSEAEEDQGLGHVCCHPS